MFEDVQSFGFLGLTIYKYGLCLALGTALWLCAAWLLSAKKNLPGGTILLTGVLAIPLGLLFARVTFCLISLAYYLETIGQPIAMLYFWDGGFSMMGALLGVSLAALIVARVKKMQYGRLMDVLAVAAGAFLVVARLSETFTTLGRGKTINVAWMRDNAFFGIRETWSEDVFHAVFRYEAAIAALILLVMICLFFGRKTNATAKSGDLALVFGGLFGSAQVILESLRDDGHLLWGFVRASQVISILLPVAAIAIFSIRLIQREGMGIKVIASWLVAAGAIAIGIIKEFDIDTSNNLLREYLIMSLSMATLAAVMLMQWKWAKNQKQLK